VLKGHSRTLARAAVAAHDCCNTREAMASDASPIVPPIVVAEGWDLTFHRSEADVLAQYEPWFPSSAEYRAFDSEGRRLELVADPPIARQHLLGPVWTDNAHESLLLIRPTETAPGGADELIALLRGWLPRAGLVRDDLDKLTLDELMREAIGRTGFAP
jgi:hypothetical protein